MNAVDTNIVLYAVDTKDPVKQAKAAQLLAENDLGETIRATPALVDGVVYVRTARHLWAFGPN